MMALLYFIGLFTFSSNGGCQKQEECVSFGVWHFVFALQHFHVAGWNVEENFNTPQIEENKDLG